MNNSDSSSFLKHQECLEKLYLYILQLEQRIEFLENSK